MKRLLSFVLVLTMLATMFVGVTAVSADETETATIKLVGATVNEAGQFDVAVKLQNNTDLLAGQIGIKFDTTKLTAVSVTASDYIAAIGNDSNIVDGEVLVMFDATSAVSFAEAKDIATVKFQVAAGVDYSTVAFTLDADFTEIAAAPDYALVAATLDASEFVLADEVCLHTETREEVVTAASCTAEGSKNVICTKCGEVVETVVLPKLGHTESEWIVDKEATTDDIGSQHKECTVCGEVTATEELPLLPEEGIVLKGYGEYGPGVLHKFYDDGRLELIGKEPGAYTYNFTSKNPNPIKKKYMNDKVTSITVTGIEKLGNRAFHNFCWASSLTVDETIKEFGPWAMAYCDNLFDITINGNVELFDEGNFYQTRKIKNMNIPGYTKAQYDGINVSDSSNPWFGTYTVVVNDGKYGVIRGNDVEEKYPNVLYTWAIEKGVMTFAGANAIPNFLKDQTPWYPYRGEVNEIILPEGLTSIGQYAFRGFSKVKKLRIPSTVNTIAEFAFWSVSGIEEITMFNTLENIEGSSIINPGSGRTYTLNFVGSKDEFNAIPGSNKLSSKTLVPSTAQISGTSGDVAWSLDNHGVLYVTGAGAMADYASAADAPWAASAESIKEIVIGDDVTTVGANAFAGLANLTNVALGENTRYINAGAFANNAALATVVAYDRLFEIREGAFAECPELSLFTYFGTASSYGAVAIYKNNDAIKNATRSYAAPIAREVLETGAFTENITYTVYADGALVLSGSGKGYANYSSSNRAPWRTNSAVRNAIKYVVVERNISELYQRTFDTLANLEAIYLANTVTAITGDNVFYACPKLDTIYFGASNVTISSDKAVAGTTNNPIDVDTVIYSGSSMSGVKGASNTTLADATWVFCK